MIIQPLLCQTVIQVPDSECPCQIPENCILLRTQNVIPTTVEAYQGNLITRVSNTITGIPFTKINFERVPYVNNAKFSSGIKYFLHSRYIYFLSTVNFDSCDIYGVFNYPAELSNYTSSCSNQPCWNPDTSYFPISSYMMNALKLRIQEVNIKLFLNTSPDTTNDSKDESNTQKG